MNDIGRRHEVLQCINEFTVTDWSIDLISMIIMCLLNAMVISCEKFCEYSIGLFNGCFLFIIAN